MPAKVLAIISDSKKLRYGIVGGVQSKPVAHSSKTSTIDFPAEIDSGSGLCAMLKTLTALVASEAPTQVAVLRSGKGQHNTSGTTRPIVEALIQIVCEQAPVTCSLIHPATLRAKEKKFGSIVMQSPEAVFNGNNAFRPHEARDVFLTGWKDLPE